MFTQAEMFHTHANRTQAHGGRRRPSGDRPPVSIRD